MNDYNNFQNHQLDNSKTKIEYFNTKVLIPVGAVIIGALGLFNSQIILPFGVYLILSVYLVLVLVINLVAPVKSFLQKKSTLRKQIVFATMNKSELFDLTLKLNEFIDQNKSNSIPYFISQLQLNFSNELNLLDSLHRNQQQFQILYAWSTSISNSLEHAHNDMFLSNAIQFSSAVHWFSWSCVWLRESLNRPTIKEKLSLDLISDWNNTTQRLQIFFSRVEDLMRSINKKYNPSNCASYFMEVKQL